MENQRFDNTIQNIIDQNTGYGKEAIPTWNSLSGQVKSVNFFSFGLQHWNVYYLSFLIFVVGGAGVAGYYGSKDAGSHQVIEESVAAPEMNVTPAEKTSHAIVADSSIVEKEYVIAETDIDDRPENNVDDKTISPEKDGNGLEPVVATPANEPVGVTLSKNDDINKSDIVTGNENVESTVSHSSESVVGNETVDVTLPVATTAPIAEEKTVATKRGSKTIVFETDTIIRQADTVRTDGRKVKGRKRKKN